MNIDLLKPLISGQVPERVSLQGLTKSRQNKIYSFINKIPEKYSIENIQKDVDNFSCEDNKKLYFFIVNFGKIFIGVAILFFILYSALLGVGWGLLSGGIIFLCAAFLNNRLGPVLNLSKDSVKLLDAFETLYSDLVQAQKRENGK